MRGGAPWVRGCSLGEGLLPGPVARHGELPPPPAPVPETEALWQLQPRAAPPSLPFSSPARPVLKGRGAESGPGMSDRHKAALAEV